MKKVLIITYYWPPSGGGGVQRWLKLAKYLKEFNIEPFVLTVSSEYASFPHIDNHFVKEAENIKTYKTKSFEALKVYGRMVGKKNVPHSAFANVDIKNWLQTVSRFVRGNLFVPDPRKGWNKYAIKKAKEIISEYNIDTVITTSPPHSTQLIGLKLKEELNVKWIADLRDPWTDIFYYKDLLHLPHVKKKDLALELKVLTKADVVISVSDAIKNLFATKLGGKSDKLKVIPNGFDPLDFENDGKNSSEIFKFGYVGSLTEVYSPQKLFEALGQLKDKFDFHISFVGNVSPKVKEIIKNENLTDRSTFKERVSHDKAIIEMQSSDALLLFIPEVPNNEGILTGKIFEYLATRKPIIGVGPEHGDAAQILNKFSMGKMFDYESDLMVQFLRLLLTRYNNGETLINEGNLKVFSRKYQAGQIKDLIEGMG